MGQDVPVGALRLVLLEAALRRDLTVPEGDLLVALVAESARDRIVSGRAIGGPGAVGAATGSGEQPDLRALAGLAPVARVPASVSRTLRRAVLPGWLGVVGWLVTASVLWTRPPAAVRGEGLLVLLVALGAAVSAGLLAAMHRSSILAVDLGATGSALTARARSVGALVEKVLREGDGPLSPSPGRPSLLLTRLRSRAHRMVLRVHACALAAGVLLYTGLMRALGLL